MVLNNEEMLNVNGGAVSTTYYLQLSLIGGVVLFLTGVLDGILHPKKC